MKVLFCDNDLRSFINFRGEILNHFVAMGYAVVIVVPQVSITDQIHMAIPTKVNVIGVKMSPNSSNPVRDIPFLLQLIRVYKREAPDVVFHYTVKPNIYGTLASKLLRLRSVAMVAGLGYMFSGNSVSLRLGRILYKFALRRSDKVLTLNRENTDLLITKGFVSRSKIKFLAGGEGINLNRFQYSVKSFEQTRLIMIARVLYDKGYTEYVEAARLVKKRYPSLVFELLGPLAPDSPMGVPKQRLEKDCRDGLIDYLGITEDVAHYLSRDGVVMVLPSYHEGMSRSLMEACAIGCPCITTDIPGCRESVDDGENGYLVAKKDSASLADAIIRFMELPKEKKQLMSRHSREKAVMTFDVRYVIAQYDLMIRDCE